jgi:nucleoside 2-deoxyribosyltransferase
MIKMKCFVIQPFDGNTFDRRYDDSFAPAIKKAGLEPYRVDKDFSTDIPIDQIEKEIKESAACLADITLDNPNVWYELGYAMASKIPFCIICSSERQNKYPFDIQHKSVISYRTDSKGAYLELEEKITKRLKAVIESRQEQREIIHSPILGELDGLNSCEIAVLRFLTAEEIVSPTVYGNILLRVMEEATDFGRPDIGLALSNLRTIEYVDMRIETDWNNNEARVYNVTERGREWLRTNKTAPTPTRPKAAPVAEPVPEDDIPF